MKILPILNTLFSIAIVIWLTALNLSIAEVIENSNKTKIAVSEMNLRQTHNVIKMSNGDGYDQFWLRRLEITDSGYVPVYWRAEGILQEMVDLGKEIN